MMSSNRKMQNLFQVLPRVAETDANILIVGESGTGKELLAKNIHSLSPRAKNELVCVNCAAIPEALLESELFGHKKGSFSGAFSDHKGLFEMADGGTIFLDEIGDMPLSLQAKMLRVLQEKKIRPVGGVHEKVVDFRVIAATHQNLKVEISNHHFREDLFYRLNVIALHLPPLRERKEDIPALISHFLSFFAAKYGVPISRFSAEATDFLINRAWPGNIRELENLVEHITIMYQGNRTLEIEDIPFESDVVLEDHQFRWVFQKYEKFPTLAELNNDYIHFILNKVDLHQGEAARILGLSRRTIYRKLNSQTLDEFQDLNLQIHKNHKSSC